MLVFHKGQIITDRTEMKEKTPVLFTLYLLNKHTEVDNLHDVMKTLFQLHR